MGYYILGIIIFLLLAVFVSDLIRSARESDNIDTFDTDEYFERLSSQYPGTFSYREEFSEDYIEQEQNDEEGNVDQEDLNYKNQVDAINDDDLYEDITDENKRR